jgi:hypothetical protein
MKPIKSKIRAKPCPAPAHSPIVDLRKLNMVHAAPIVADRAVLTLRYDPTQQALMPHFTPHPQ